MQSGPISVTRERPFICLKIKNKMKCPLCKGNVVIVEFFGHETHVSRHTERGLFRMYCTQCGNEYDEKLKYIETKLQKQKDIRKHRNYVLLDKLSRIIRLERESLE